MSIPDDISHYLDGFDGVAPLFPLPGAVLFPNLLLPLHMFEPRYRQMTADAVAGEGFLTLATLQPGYESLYETKHAPIFPNVCLGRILNEERLPDGRYFLVLQGLSRAIVEEEIETAHPYRMGRLKLLTDEVPDDGEFNVTAYREQFGRALQRVPPSRISMEMRDEILNSQLPIGTLCDLTAHVLNLPTPSLREVSETLNVQARSELVLRHLVEAGREFPPPFSVN
ncbi:LON peptidase substrate-binding domain-containing protein [Thalassoroseus pseudoceratinae]|uniref:LON peptidase substrate-binding domain-containing protein n=1 Tax=Thalassoroseus pseudoceratinae TaxID=2713176 RepID=UPI00141E39FA|nr:LON peptidase substrate-binding domain-containing protein [Thalassoroseus pseudoceratinae]